MLGKVLGSYIAQGYGESSGYWIFGPCHVSQGHSLFKVRGPLSLGSSAAWTYASLSSGRLRTIRSWLSKCSKATTLPLGSFPCLGCSKVAGQDLSDPCSHLSQSWSAQSFPKCPFCVLLLPWHNPSRHLVLNKSRKSY